MQRLLSVTMGLLVVAFSVVGCASKPSARPDAEWVTLIDGANGLENWSRVGDGNWRGIDGAIQVDHRNNKDYSFLLTKNSYTDFRIRAEFWVSDDANSGIFMRCSDPVKLTDRTCYEANVYDQRPDPNYGTGAIVHIAKVVPMPKAGGKWNTYDITVKGSHLTVVLNGVRTVDIDDSTHARGPIALQYAGGTVKFRKVQIQAL